MYAVLVRRYPQESPNGWDLESAYTDLVDAVGGYRSEERVYGKANVKIFIELPTENA